ncbi:phosphatase PAP2 family protein [Bacteroidales bacterium OttesenSCG-928-A17]|nr:phosphatase PAP2 family protein [Bacteroidales bacterium OttesenSCG-928-A17]
MVFILSFFFPFSHLNAQISTSDSTKYDPINYPKTGEGVRFSAKQLIVPVTLSTMGVIGMIEKDFDKKTRDKISDIQGNTSIDNILPFVSPGAVYILNWVGIEGKHNFVDRTVLLGSSAIITSVLVYSSKSLINRNRPDGKGDDSFPSMHTAVAFMGAEFLRQEFGDQSVWYGIAGYTLAAGTGFLRMYNDRHWLSDVLAGAGIGILSTKIAYWIYPEIRKLYAGSKLDGFQFAPFLTSTNDFGVCLAVRF